MISVCLFGLFADSLVKVVSMSPLIDTGQFDNTMQEFSERPFVFHLTSIDVCSPSSFGYLTPFGGSKECLGR